MLYIIGLGLADERDISVKGLEIVRKVDRVYLEAYTAILLVDKEKLVSLCNDTVSRCRFNEQSIVGSLLWTFNRSR